MIIVYLAHGGPKYYVQTKFSVLSLLNLLIRSNRNDINIIIFTDNIEIHPKHDLIKTIDISSQLRQFYGPLQHAHRVKLEVLKLTEHKFGLPFIYVDGDSKWLQIPDQPFVELSHNPVASNRRISQTFFMHIAEQAVSNEFFPKYAKFLNNRKNTLAKFGIREQSQYMMWNAGVIGIPASAPGTISRILDLTDYLALYLKPRHWTEQLAVSLVATSDFAVRPFDAYLTHYWNFGFALPVVLERFFQQLPNHLTIEQLAQECANFNISEITIQGIPQSKNRFNQFKASVYKRFLDIKAFMLRYKFIIRS
ncbi:hypothetical protein TI04_01915 [Achromatium sp. WMS2]|nr:hypothetical protein TI04_01915 [Achromatium sp. WMS2]